MKQRLIALSIVTAFFLFSVAFGFIIGKALNKTTVVQNTSDQQSNPNVEQIITPADGVSALIPETKFNRYLSKRGVTFVYPSTSDMFEKGEEIGVTEVEKDGVVTISLYLMNHDVNLYKQSLILHPKLVYEKAENFIKAKFGLDLTLDSTDLKLKVRRFLAGVIGRPASNLNINDYQGTSGHYFIEFLDDQSYVAEWIGGSDSIFDTDLEIVNSISMVKK